MFSKLIEDPAAIKAHLLILQNTIKRMANNSRDCKTWCIVVVSALILAPGRVSPYICLPIALFLVLDAYYLAHERSFRRSYDMFVQRLHSKKIKPEELFRVRPSWDLHLINSMFKAIFSFSILPVYWMLLLLVNMDRLARLL